MTKRAKLAALLIPI